MLRLLLFPEGTEGGDNTPAPTAPPAASAVVKSDAQPEDAAEMVRLKRELDDEKRLRKEREVRLSELEDENRVLKTPAPAPAPKAKRSGGKWTFFDPDEDESPGAD